MREAPRLERLDQMIADIGPLRTSIRDMGVDLRADTGFDTVFRLTDGPYGTLARSSGALIAVFPRSQYLITSKGKVHVEVPANTVFHLGPLPEPEPEERAAPGILSVSSAADSRVPMRTESASPMRVGPGEAILTAEHRSVQTDPRTDSTEPPGMMTDDGYRRSRLRQLLERAAGG